MRVTVGQPVAMVRFRMGLKRMNARLVNVMFSEVMETQPVCMCTQVDLCI